MKRLAIACCVLALLGCNGNREKEIESTAYGEAMAKYRGESKARDEIAKENKRKADAAISQIEKTAKETAPIQ